jgi:GntR family transcriptional regulator/MocR family aminotransferase
MARLTPSPLPVSLDRSASLPLTAQLAASVRSSVQRGALRSGERLPSTRALAVDLGVARGVVAEAFDQLVAEGWLVGVRGAGTYVAPGVDVAAGGARRAKAAAPIAEPAAPVVRLDSGTPWIDDRLRAGWRRAWRRVATARMPPGYTDPRGLPELRAALADHVARHRGVECAVDDVMITSGTAHGLRLALETLPRGPVAIEDPGYRAAVATATATGHAIVDVPVDDEGIDVDSLRAARDAVCAVYVTPAHQHPLGHAMSAARRVALLAEARRRGALVVEDDYDSEFRYDVAPLPALAQLDRARVVYLGTASKTLGPGLRIGWLVGPRRLVADVARRREVQHDCPPWPAQAALLSMLEEGHLTRLVRAARRQYARRSQLVRAALAPFGEVAGGAAGMYVALELSAAIARRVARRALAEGVEAPLLADYCRTARRAGLVLGYGGVADEELDRALDVLVRALRAEGAA